MGVIFLNQKAYHWQVTSSGLSATRNGNRATANTTVKLARGYYYYCGFF
ncbi:hypothetical protein KSL4_1953 [Leuconostoc inhae]|uniref:Uncharacterized protein n=1 Tax=Leuconostoc inhae TaxID=178001 RepID=A0ABP2B250_9LACO|nr:hypothetical protein [Leuconostoc carnosum]CUW04486.1 hypothetical protein KSL4_1953 [Leuconostoc inhae]